MKRTITAMDIERGAKLKALREAAGLLMRQVGAEFDIDKAAVSSWEAGRTRPSVERLGRLDSLYGGTGEVLALFGVTPPASAGEVAELRQRVIVLAEQVQGLARDVATLGAEVQRGRRATRPTTHD